MANITVNNILACGSCSSSAKKSCGCCCCKPSDVPYKGIWAGLFLVKAKQNSYLDAIDQLNGTNIASSSTKVTSISTNG